MEINIGEVKRAYISKDGDISVRQLIFKIKLIDPTSMVPDMQYDRWRVYSPYDVRVWMEPGTRVRFYLGMGFRVPPGFLLYMYLNPTYRDMLDMEEMFITPENTDDVVLEIKCKRSFFLRKYMHIACFIIIPVLNTDFKKELMYVKPSIDEYR
jgi:hypothetical protein